MKNLFFFSLIGYWDMASYRVITLVNHIIVLNQEGKVGIPKILRVGMVKKNDDVFPISFIGTGVAVVVVTVTMTTNNNNNKYII